MSKSKSPLGIDKLTDSNIETSVEKSALSEVVSKVVVTEGSNVSAGKDPHAVALGRKGGLVGGKARAKSLTAEQRSEIARQAAKARWSNQKERREQRSDPEGS